MGKQEPMGEQEFLDFVNLNTTIKNIPVVNLNTGNVSSEARKILVKTKYAVLGKQRLSKKVLTAYVNNTAFREKMREVMEKLKITIVEPVDETEAVETDETVDETVDETETVEA